MVFNQSGAPENPIFTHTQIYPIYFQVPCDIPMKTSPICHQMSKENFGGVGAHPAERSVAQRARSFSAAMAGESWELRDSFWFEQC